MMTRLRSVSQMFKHPFWSRPGTLLGLWLLLPVVAALLKINKHNNFLIFRYVYWHSIEQLPLYEAYPHLYGDTNHYGPFFALVVAPFALLPVWWGLLLWEVALALALFYAVRRLGLEYRQWVFLCWFCAHELLTALFMSQFNIAVAALILLTWVCVERDKPGWAAFFIVVGTFVKLYGIVGLAFFFFMRRKGRFVAWLALWAVVAFAAPMLISSPHYVVEQYAAWAESLTEKCAANMFATHQNISLLGMVRKISGCATYSDLWLIGGGLLLFALPYLRLSQYRHQAFRLALLASVLLFIVLFSTGSESSSYIIALVGVALWYVTAPWKRSGWDVALLLFAFVLTSFSPSDLFPAYLQREWVKPYALKALPCVLVWLRLVYEMCTREYVAVRPDSSRAMPHAL